MVNIPPIPTVLIVSAVFTDSFMKDDLRILNQFMRVIPFEFRNWQFYRGRSWGIGIIYNILRFIYYLLRGNAKAVIFWFVTTPHSSLMAIIAKLIGRKIVVITGGGDAVYVSDIDWGAMKSKQHCFWFCILMRLADSVLPFSNSAKSIILEQVMPKRIQTVYPAIDTHLFQPNPDLIQPRVGTCVYQYNATTITQKGLDVFIQTAHLVPEIQFVVVGEPIDESAMKLQKNAPTNVLFLPRMLNRLDYRNFLQSCSIYAQLSAHEGFGVSLAEAMACGCIPVVSNRYSLPEVVGNTGFIVPYNNPQKTAEAIREAIVSDMAIRKQVRDRVINFFNHNIRKYLLLEELKTLIPTLNNSITRIELGCGSVGQPGTIGVDLRKTSRTQVVCDVRRSCFKSECADEIYSFCVLEHLDNPYELLDEVIRILKPHGQAFLRVPAIGTYSAHLDTTHRFLADLALWKKIMKGYFEEVKVIPLGTKYRDNPLLVIINQILVKGFKFYELAQGWTFVCSRKRLKPVQVYTGWWIE